MKLVRNQLLPTDVRGNVEVSLQDQFTPILELPFVQATGVSSTVSIATAVSDTSFTVADSTGFVDGDIVGLFTADGLFYFGTQLGAPVGNVISIDTPIDDIFGIGSIVLRLTNEMAVDGSVTTQIFQIAPIGLTSAVEIDITRVMGYLQYATVGDDSNFGNLGALTKGIVLRKNNGVMNNIWNAKSNGDLALTSFDFRYSERAPAGSFSARFRNTFAGQDKHGVTIRLEPGDILELLVQDALQTLESFRMNAQGHIVED